MERLTHARSFDDGHDAWEIADAAPAPVLAGAVSRYSWWRESTGSFDTRRELAATCGVFIVNLGDPVEITDAGARTIRLDAGQAFIGGMAQGTSLSRSTGAMEGIHVFMPIHELARLMAVTIGDLADRTVTLDEALGPEAQELCDRVLANNSTTNRLNELDSFLTKRLRAAAEPDTMLTYVMDKLRSENVSATAIDLGWSRKRLATWFRDSTGIRPAQFNRLSRFERFTSALQRDRRASLADLAYRAGYADQAHLTHDVRRLTGTTPATLKALLLPSSGGVRN